MNGHQLQKSFIITEVEEDFITKDDLSIYGVTGWKCLIGYEEEGSAQ
jgi:hypothetical protein